MYDTDGTTRLRRLSCLLVFCSALAGAAIPAAGQPATGATNAPFWTGMRDAGAFEAAMAARLAHARELLASVLAVNGGRTIENTLGPFDDISLELSAVNSQCELIGKAHPDEQMRKVADKVMQAAAKLSNEVSLNRGVYEAIAALDIAGADAETKHYVENTLRDFRLAGVDRDEATRGRIAELRDELVQIGQEFSQNIRTDVRKVPVKDAKDLDGLPADFIARHKPDADGVITLTTDYPDSLPVFSYATSDGVRKRMYMEYNNRAYPKNIDVLDRMLARRAELAHLLGFSDWANYVTADKMSGSATTVSAFIDRIAEAAKARAAREYEAVLKRKQQDVPGASVVNAWESAYYAELVRKADYDFDSQSVRPYFGFDRVKQGLLDVTGRLFSVTYRRVDVPVWDPSVEAYEMLEGGTVVGRFYFDMHPRPNKYNHAATFPIRTGIAGRQIPEAALVCNLPGGTPGEPGLMTHDDVETLFHEYGHLLHVLLAGRHRWIGIGGISTEWDFVEAPSQMLEEWTWDPATLATFARHYQTDEAIPAALVRRMRRAHEFGKALGVRTQMLYAKLSLSIYDRDPKTVDTTTMVRELTAKYRPYPYVEGTHFQTAFDHLDGYSAIYYTYMWSLVIAKDLFSQFDRANLLAPGVAHRYREAVLAPGGSKPAAALVRDFLGRPFDFKAWEAWLNRDEQ